MPRLLFRSHAGPGIGLGHLQRCLSLASELRDRFVECEFLINSDPSARARVEESGFACHCRDLASAGDDVDLAETLRFLNASRCNVVVVDFYSEGSAYLEGLRSAGFLTVAIDDLASHSFPCNLVINGAICAESLRYQSSTGDTKFLLGPKYAMLRREFRDVTRRVTREHVQELLITMGGADGSNLTPRIIEAVDAVDGQFSVTVIVGPYFRNHAEIADVVAGCKRSVRLVDDPSGLRELALGADVAISGGGQTLYELAVCGTPTMAVEVAANQACNVRGFSRRDAVLPIIPGAGSGVGISVSATLSRLIRSLSIRQEMSAAAMSLVDGLGSWRVAGEIAVMLSAEYGIESR